MRQLDLLLWSQEQVQLPQLHRSPLNIKRTLTPVNLHNHSASYRPDVWGAVCHEGVSSLLSMGNKRQNRYLIKVEMKYLGIAGNSQDAEGIRSLDGLTVPDEEASISRCLGEKILSFGAGDVAVTPRLGSRHPAAAAAAAGGSSSNKAPTTDLSTWPLSRTLWSKTSPRFSSFQPHISSLSCFCTAKVAHCTCPSLVPCDGGRQPQLWTSSFARLREEGLKTQQLALLLFCTARRFNRFISK